MDTFDDPALPGWEHSPNVTAVNGVLRIPPGGFAFHSGRWSDVQLDIALRLTGSGAAMIKYSATDQSGYIVRFAGGSLALQRQSAGATTDVGQAGHEIPPGELVLIQVTVSGSQHEIAVNKRSKITVSDPQPLPAGGLFLSAEGTTVEIDQITLIAGSAGPPDLSWVRTGGPIGGLGYDIRVNFKDPNTWYVTDAFSGFYISTDDGKTWQPVLQLNADTGACDVLVDPSDPQTVFAAMYSRRRAP
ncbi:MAG: hypothetical protein AAB403_13160, partial [Planctomycetota bacterium]